MAKEKLRITVVECEDCQGIYVNDENVYFGDSQIGTEAADALATGIIDAIGTSNLDVIVTTLDGLPFIEANAVDYLPESLKDLKKDLKDIEKGLKDEDEDSEEEY